MFNQELSKSNLAYSKVKTWNEILFRNRRRIYKSSILPGSPVVEVVVVVVVIVVVLFFCNTPTSRMMRLLYSTSQVQVDVYALPKAYCTAVTLCSIEGITPLPCRDCVIFEWRCWLTYFCSNIVNRKHWFAIFEKAIFDAIPIDL